VIDSFPFDEWSEDITAFWTFGPENSTGTYIMTVLGIILMVGAIVYWVWLENIKLNAQAELLRGAGGLPPASPTAPGPGLAEPPLGGPSTDPGP
jgi:hypothetical protein